MARPHPKPEREVYVLERNPRRLRGKVQRLLLEDAFLAARLGKQRVGVAFTPQEVEQYSGTPATFKDAPLRRLVSTLHASKGVAVGLEDPFLRVLSKAAGRAIKREDSRKKNGARDALSWSDLVTLGEVRDGLDKLRTAHLLASMREKGIWKAVVDFEHAENAGLARLPGVRLRTLLVRPRSPARVEETWRMAPYGKAKMLDTLAHPQEAAAVRKAVLSVLGLDGTGDVLTRVPGQGSARKVKPGDPYHKAMRALAEKIVLNRDALYDAIYQRGTWPASGPIHR